MNRKIEKKNKEGRMFHFISPLQLFIAYSN